MYQYSVTRENETHIVGGFSSEQEALEHMLHSFKHELIEAEAMFDGVYGSQKGNYAIIYGTDDDDNDYIITKYELGGTIWNSKFDLKT